MSAPTTDCPYAGNGCTFQGTEDQVEDHVLYLQEIRDAEHDPAPRETDVAELAAFTGQVPGYAPAWRPRQRKPWEPTIWRRFTRQGGIENLALAFAGGGVVGAVIAAIQSYLT